MRIAVFASGSGSNFGAVVEAIKSQSLRDVEVVLLVCDKPEAFVVKRAREASVPVFAFRAKDYQDKLAYETEIIRQLREAKVDLIVLAGYMRLIGSTLLQEFEGKMINLHPSLLPAFAGKDAIGQALEYGVKVTGVTVHFVDKGMDTGPIIAQRPVLVTSGETLESLSKKIQEQEHQLLPEVIGWFQKGLVSQNGRRVDIHHEESIN